MLGIPCVAEGLVTMDLDLVGDDEVGLRDA